MRAKKKVFVLLLAIATVVIWSLVATVVVSRHSEKPEASRMAKATVSDAKAKVVPEDPPPVIPEGTPSWRVVEARFKLDQPRGYEAFFSQINGVTRQQVSTLANLEKMGYNFQRVLPAGTRLTNTGIENGQFAVYSQTLSRDRPVLIGLDGQAKVLVICGNPIILKPVPPGVPPEEKCELPGTSPLSTIGDKDNPASQADGAHSAPADGSPKAPSPDGKSHKESPASTSSSSGTENTYINGSGGGTAPSGSATTPDGEIIKNTDPVPAPTTTTESTKTHSGSSGAENEIGSGFPE